MTEDVNEQAPACPNCASTDVVAIIYGAPSPEGFAMVQRGERELGGCTLTPDAPMWACKACHERFGNHAAFFSQMFPTVFARLQARSKQSSATPENEQIEP
jgi:ribosomal protein L37AE/L43A